MRVLCLGQKPLPDAETLVARTVRFTSPPVKAEIRISVMDQPSKGMARSRTELFENAGIQHRRER